MLLDQATKVMEMLVKEIRETEPEKRDHFINSAITLLEISTEALQISPEFRKAFAKVHAEFLKYPESLETINQGLQSYREYKH